MLKNNKYILIYARISTSEQRSNTSIKNQIKTIKEYFNKNSNKNTNIEIFTDIQSGSKTANRKGYNDMLNRINILLDNKFKVVIAVYAIDRLHRSALNLLKFINFIKKKDISFVSVTQNIDTSTYNGVLMIQILGSFAEHERKTFIERSARGRLYTLQKKHAYIGGGIAYGYKYNTKTKKIYINKNKIPIIKNIYKLRKQGININKITSIIKNKYPNENIYYSRIYRVLKDTSYFGKKQHKILNNSGTIKVPAILGNYWKLNK